MWNYLQLALLLAAALSVPATPDGPFTASLTAAKLQEVGEKVSCQVLITNSDNTGYYLLKRNTPLEQLPTNIYTVKKGANLAALKFGGSLVKGAWGSPSEEDYIWIPGKSSVHSDVELSKAYSFDSPDVYSVKLDTQVLYSKSLTDSPSSQQLSSNKICFFVMATGNLPKLTEPEGQQRKKELIQGASDKSPQTRSPLSDPIFQGDWPDSYRQQAIDKYIFAFVTCRLSYFKAKNDESLFTKWFGSPTASNIDYVSSVYNQVWSKMSQTSFVLHYNGALCEFDNNFYAYSYHSSQTIYFCEPFFTDAGLPGHDSKVGILIHELTHAVCDIDDLVHGKAAVLELAAADPEGAINNCDNYQFYSEAIVLRE